MLWMKLVYFSTFQYRETSEKGSLWKTKASFVYQNATGTLTFIASAGHSSWHMKHS